jgi:Zn-dependent protease with chaperone function
MTSLLMKDESRRCGGSAHAGFSDQSHPPLKNRIARLEVLVHAAK